MKLKKQLEHTITGRNSSCRGILTAGGKLYAGFVYDKDGFYESLIQCLDSTDFTVVWEYRYRHVVFSMFISQHHTLILNFMNGNVQAFDLESGKNLWTFEVGMNIGMISNETAGKVVVSGIQSGPVNWCIDTAKGELLWQSERKGHAYVPVIHDHRVYNTEGHHIFCEDFSDGSKIWENREPETYLTRIHIFKNVVIATGHGILNFYDLQTGKLLGTIATGMEKAIGFIVSEDNQLYFGDEGGSFYCYQVDAAAGQVTAALVWKTEAGAAVTKRAIVAADSLYIAVEDHGLLIVSKERGEILLEKKIKGQGSHVAVDGDAIYFGGKVSLLRFVEM